MLRGLEARQNRAFSYLIRGTLTRLFTANALLSGFSGIQNLCLLGTHLHPVSHVLLHVDRAARLHPDRSELPALTKRVFADFPECSWKRDFLDSTTSETSSSNTFYSVWNLNILEMHAPLERTLFEPLQRGREVNAFYCAVCESVSCRFVRVGGILRPQFLQAFVQVHALQLLAALKRLCADFPHARGESDLFETTVLETFYPDLLEPTSRLE